MKHRVWVAFGCAMLLAGCRERLQPENVPTQASIESIATSMPLTQNAAPPELAGQVTRFSAVDVGLNELHGARYTVQLAFDGVFTGTTQAADASIRAEVVMDQISSARRVSATTTGSINDGSTAPVTTEAVRLGPDAFIVRDAACTTLAGSAPNTAADLTASSLIGGASPVTAAGRRATINNADAFLMSLAPDSLLLPAVSAGETGTLTLDSGELWVSAEHEVAVRYYLNLTIDNGELLDLPRPVTGTVIVRYDVTDLDQPNNLTVPFGC